MLDNMMHDMIYTKQQLVEKYNHQGKIGIIMNDQTESVILEFLKRETLQGHIEATMREIANGTKLVYNHVGRALERLLLKDQVRYWERGTERKAVRYYYLKDILDMCREKWKA